MIKKEEPKTKEQQPTSKEKVQDLKKQKIAEALRDNLRRRKKPETK